MNEKTTTKKGPTKPIKCAFCGSINSEGDEKHYITANAVKHQRRIAICDGCVATCCLIIMARNAGIGEDARHGNEDVISKRSGPAYRSCDETAGDSLKGRGWLAPGWGK